jgi:hypothetical protein
VSPVLEHDGELQRGLGLAHELGLVETDHGVEIADGRNGCFADPDDADVVRLDEGYPGVRPQGSL